MALTLTLQLGSKILVGNHTVSVDKVFSSSDMIVGCDGTQFMINEDEWVDVAPGVQLRAPFPKAGRTTGVRLQIEAPLLGVKRL